MQSLDGGMLKVGITNFPRQREAVLALEIAAEDLGFKIEPITTKQDGL